MVVGGAAIQKGILAQGWHRFPRKKTRRFRAINDWLKEIGQETAGKHDFKILKKGVPVPAVVHTFSL